VATIHAATCLIAAAILRNAGQWLAGLTREGCLQSLREGSTDLAFPGVPSWCKAGFSATQQLEWPPGMS